MARKRDEPEVHSLTSARRGHAEDQHGRMVRYAISMGIRTVCVVLAVVVDGPLRWVFVAGAVLLPYVAVVLANAGRERGGDLPQAPTLVPLAALPAAGPDSELPPTAR